ncbi:iron ABC transporter permease [Agromyces albus]|uniref:Iron ABC transporter permease n=1 Tax=Agromyces albus TaxID=205332 RepID=A0A4Q2KXE2_9MICO|nr:iron ABC transporter permease [Agromyces albus]
MAGGRGAAVVALLVLCAASIALGSRAISVDSLLGLLDATAPVSTDVTVIRDMRVPRTLLGLAAGAALGLGGVLLQGVARNPLADPGIMGINAGAAAAIVIVIVGFGAQAAEGYVWFAFLGAGIATMLVYAIAAVGRDGATPVKLALSGAAATACFTSITSALVLSNVDALNELRVWQVGALSGRYWPVLEQLAPFFVFGIVAALATGRPLNTLAMGDELAHSLGMRVARTRVIVFLIVTVLCGVATAACGPIVFLGLMVPHLARLICGPDYRWILAYSLLLGPIVLLACDLLGRLVAAPGEVPVGVVLGIVGAPVFIALVRYRRAVEL